MSVIVRHKGRKRDMGRWLGIRECYLDETRSSFHFLYTTFMADINVGHQHSTFSLWVFASVHICTLRYYHYFLPSKVEILILSIKLRITLFKIVFTEQCLNQDIWRVKKGQPRVRNFSHDSPDFIRIKKNWGYLSQQHVNSWKLTQRLTHIDDVFISIQVNS